MKSESTTDFSLIKSRSLIPALRVECTTSVSSKANDVAEVIAVSVPKSFHLIQELSAMQDTIIRATLIPKDKATPTELQQGGL
jgi:hypothetical protein